MKNNQKEKVSITVEVEKDFIKAVMQASGFSTKELEDATKELDNVVINEHTFQKYNLSGSAFHQIKLSVSEVFIGMILKKYSCYKREIGLVAKLQTLQEEQRKMKGEEES